MTQATLACRLAKYACDFPTASHTEDLVALAQSRVLEPGEKFVSEVITGPGSVEPPMTTEAFERKFRKMAAPHLSAYAQDQVLDFVSTLEHQSDYEPLFTAMERSEGESA